MATEDGPAGLLWARELDGNGGGRALDARAVAAWRPANGPCWVHLDRTAPGVADWLAGPVGLDEWVLEALLDDATRPRVTLHEDGLLINLRGVNLNPDADPEDMVSVRMWVDRQRVVTLRGPKLLAAEDVMRRLDVGAGPVTSGGVLAAIGAALVERMQPVLDALEDELDEFEEALLDDGSVPRAAGISAVRRRAIVLRRYLAPQREAMQHLQGASVAWLTEFDRLELRETLDRLTRCIEDLDAVRERGAVTHEQVSERLSLRMNRTMYVLSLVAAVFLPLSFVTGLLGINVGGIPWAGTGWGFVIVCTLLVLLLALELLLLRRWRWLE